MVKQGVLAGWRPEMRITFLLLCLSLSGWHCCRQLLGVLLEQLKKRCTRAQLLCILLLACSTRLQM